MAEWPGVAFPFGPSVRSVFDPKSDPEVIKSSIECIVLTRVGERFMLPEFGTPVPDLVHEPNLEESALNVANAVREAIQAWDDRVEFVNCAIERQQNELSFKVQCRHLSDPLRRATRFLEVDLTPTKLGEVSV